jgi:RHS repeat-associated protein
VTRPSGTETGTYDDQDRLLTYGDATYGYTKAGELRFKAEAGDTTFYQYDALGNLMEVNLPDGTDIEYVVDGFNRRVGKKVDGVLVQGFLYQDQLNPVAELDSAGNVVSQFVYGTRGNVPDYLIRNDTTHRIVADHLGSVRLVVNVTDRTVVQRVVYDEFGREDEFGHELDDTNPGFQPFGYAGGLLDGQTRLTRFGVRDYDSEGGRWTTRDPFNVRKGPNGYSYVAANPINLIDPVGKSACDPPRIPCRIGLAGLELIMRFEGWSARQYPDQTGHPTIGFGHLIQPGETFPEPLTREQGIALLCLDIARIVNPALDLISVPLEQHQVDALASFIFNVGNGAFGSSTLLILLNQGNYDAVPGQLARWVYSNGQRLSGLVRRRAEEAALFGREE